MQKLKSLQSQVLSVNPYGAAVTILCPQSFLPMSDLCAQIRGLYYKTEDSLFWEEGKAIFCTRYEEYCAHRASCSCQIYVPRSGDYTIRLKARYLGRSGKPYFAHGTKNHLTEFCKNFKSEIKKLREFEDSDCRFGARVRKTAGARSCYIPELLALKGFRTWLCMLRLQMRG